MVDAPDWPVAAQPVLGTDGGPRRWLEYVAFRALVGGVSRMPVAVRELATGAFARLAYAVDREHRRAAGAFLRVAFGELEPADESARVLEAYRHLIRVVLDIERLRRAAPHEDLLERCEVHWTDEVRALVEGDGGCVLATAHVGAWEAAAPFLARLGFAPLYAVGKPTKNRPLSAWIQRSREELGVRLLPRRGAMKLAPEVLGGGGSLGLLLDQNARKKPVIAPFFGRPAHCDRSAGVLIRRLRVPVVVLACYREGDGRFSLHFRDVLSPDELAGSDPAAISTRLNANFEHMIRERPEQYFWLHDRFKKTPATWDEAGGLPARAGIPSMGGESGGVPSDEGS